MQRRNWLALVSALAAGCAATKQIPAAGLVDSAVVVPSASTPAPAVQESDAEALAKKLSNPIASLISVPLQLNYDEDIGPGDEGSRLQLNVQPVIPVTLNDDWNLISRTILPLLSTEDIPPGNDETGIGDVLQSVFFSPKEPTESGLIWGAGPAVLLPTASDDTLGGEKWGLGPTAVMLKQSGPWTYGGLANHIWSFAGDDDRDDISSTFLQPFATYTTPSAWTFGLNSESTYNWEESDWAVPINATVSKLTRFGKLPVSLTAGLRYWVEDAEGGPEGLGLRFGLTFLFPK